MISIIIPVYNAEKYLQECIESILSQDYQDFELILVNDGSTDGSKKICSEYESMDNRILLINKPNEGVSIARNQGIERAHGDFIIFVDADDLLEPHTLNCISKAMNEKIPLIVYGFHCTGNGNIKNDTVFLKTLSNIASSEILLQKLLSIDKNNRLCGYVGRCAYQKEFLIKYNLRFSPDIKMCEDLLFLSQALTVAQQVIVIPEELYIYRLNADSVTSRYIPYVHKDMLKVHCWLQNILPSTNPVIQRDVLCHRAEIYLLTIQNMCLSGTPFSLIARVRQAWQLKKEYGYTEAIQTVCKYPTKISFKRFLVYFIFLLYLEPIYILLFSKKKKTINAFRSKKT